MTQEELIREVGKVIPNGVYSEEVIQLAFHMFQHGYNHAIDKACEWMTNYFVKYLQFDEQIVKDFRKGMEE